MYENETRARSTQVNIFTINFTPKSLIKCIVYLFGKPLTLHVQYNNLNRLSNVHQYANIDEKYNKQYKLLRTKVSQPASTDNNKYLRITSLA